MLIVVNNERVEEDMKNSQYQSKLTNEFFVQRIDKLSRTTDMYPTSQIYTSEDKLDKLVFKAYEQVCLTVNMYQHLHSYKMVVSIDDKVIKEKSFKFDKKNSEHIYNALPADFPLDIYLTNSILSRYEIELEQIRVPNVIKFELFILNETGKIIQQLHTHVFVKNVNEEIVEPLAKKRIDGNPQISHLTYGILGKETNYLTELDNHVKLKKSGLFTCINVVPDRKYKISYEINENHFDDYDIFVSSQDIKRAFSDKETNTIGKTYFGFYNLSEVKFTLPLDFMFKFINSQRKLRKMNSIIATLWYENQIIDKKELMVVFNKEVYR